MRAVARVAVPGLLYNTTSSNSKMIKVVHAVNVNHMNNLQNGDHHGSHNHMEMYNNMEGMSCSSTTSAPHESSAYWTASPAAATPQRPQQHIMQHIPNQNHQNPHQSPQQQNSPTSLLPSPLYPWTRSQVENGLRYVPTLDNWALAYPHGGDILSSAEFLEAFITSGESLGMHIESPEKIITMTPRNDIERLVNALIDDDRSRQLLVVVFPVTDRKRFLNFKTQCRNENMASQCFHVKELEKTIASVDALEMKMEHVMVALGPKLETDPWLVPMTRDEGIRPRRGIVIASCLKRTADGETVLAHVSSVDWCDVSGFKSHTTLCNDDEHAYVQYGQDILGALRESHRWTCSFPEQIFLFRDSEEMTIDQALLDRIRNMYTEHNQTRPQIVALQVDENPPLCHMEGVCHVGSVIETTVTAEFGQNIEFFMVTSPVEYPDDPANLVKYTIRLNTSTLNCRQIQEIIFSACHLHFDDDENDGFKCASIVVPMKLAQRNAKDHVDSVEPFHVPRV